MKIARFFAYLTVLIVLFLFLPGASPQKAYTSSNIRTISVCLLNDKESPVNESIFRKILVSVSCEYEKNAGIRFEAGTVAVFSGNTGILPVNYERYLKYVCRLTDEVRIIFTSESMEFPRPDGKTEELVAHTDEDTAVIIMYNVGNYARALDWGGNPFLETVLKHEIAHLFGVDHTEDKNSFMYPQANLSLGRWTSEAERVIKINKIREWIK